MDEAVLLSAFLLTVAIAAFHLQARPFVAALLRGYHPAVGGIFVWAVLAMCVCAMVSLAALPIPFLYILLYMLHYAEFRFFSSAPAARVFLCTNLCSAHLIALHLLCLGAMALWGCGSPTQILARPAPWLFSLAAAWAAVGVMTALLQKLVDPVCLAEFFDKASVRKSVKWSAWLAIAYAGFDSIPLLFDQPHLLVWWFLVGSCLLLGIQLYIFLFYIYRISARQHYEQECAALDRQISEHLKNALRLRDEAYVDKVTGAYTRGYVMGVMRQWLAARRSFALVFADLDGLKDVNDAFGHDAGDIYLVTVAETLNRSLRKQDILARFGGDEFLILMHGASASQAKAVMRQAARKLSNLRRTYPQSFSYGVVEVASGEEVIVEDILHRADMRMYENKKTAYCRSRKKA